MDAVKSGLRNTAINAVNTLGKFVDPELNRGLSPKLQLDAAKTIVSTVFRMQGILSDGNTKQQKVTNNIMQVNTNADETGSEVFSRVMQDMGSISPVANMLYNSKDEAGEQNG